MASSSVTSTPFSDRYHAAESPAGPAPTTATFFPARGGTARGVMPPVAASRSATYLLMLLIASGSSTRLRRHCSSQGWGQILPMTAGMGLSRRISSTASAFFPFATRPRYPWTSTLEGQVRVQGALQSP